MDAVATCKQMAQHWTIVFSFLEGQVDFLVAEDAHEMWRWANVSIFRHCLKAELALMCRYEGENMMPPVVFEHFEGMYA